MSAASREFLELSDREKFDIAYALQYTFGDTKQNLIDRIGKSMKKKQGLKSKHLISKDENPMQ